MAKAKERSTSAKKPEKPVAKTAIPRSRKAASGTAADAPANGQTKLSPEEVYRLIQESAYFKAKARGFAPGHEVQDWIEAEAEVRMRLESRA
jgi:hypothetical protein